MTWTIYFLSVADGASSALRGLTVAAVATAVACGVWILAASDVCNDEQDRAGLRASARKTARAALVCALVFGVSGVFIPSRRGIIEAYLMVEGSKVVNVETTEKIAGAAATRVDKFLDALEAKWTQEAKQP